jgi:2-iminobutanoate/2-iminopropanoate deaminase
MPAEFIVGNRDREAMAKYGLGGAAAIDNLMFCGGMALDIANMCRVKGAETIADETRICFEGIAETLAFGGCTLKDIVKVNCYLTDDSFRQEYWDEFKRTFAPGPYPKRLTLVGGLAADCRVELEVMAVRPGGEVVSATTGPRFHELGETGRCVAAGGSRLVYTSSSAVNPATRKRVEEADTVYDETKVIIERIERSLGAAGLTLRDLAKVTCFVSDEQHRFDFIYAYRDLLAPGPYPSRATYSIGLVGDCRVQIDAIAVRRDETNTPMRG